MTSVDSVIGRTSLRVFRTSDPDGKGRAAIGEADAERQGNYVRDDSVAELIKAINRFSWALSLFGVSQFPSILSSLGSGPQQRRASAAVDTVTRATEDQLNDAVKATFLVGDQLLKGSLDLMLGILTMEAFTPRRMMRMTFDLMEQSSVLFGLLTHEQNSRAAWQEFKNKLQTFNLFEHADSALNISWSDDLSLTRLVERANSLEPDLAVWATEGLGHYYAERVWEQDGPPIYLLRDSQAGRLPPQSMIALHAGMGLSFANHVLEAVKPQSPASGIRKALEEFVMLCRINSREGFAEAAIESIGLVARNLYPQMLYTVDEQFSAIDPDLLPYFWHGVGRAIYFAPQNFIPCGNSSWHAVEMCGDEPPHELGRLNALAGLAWAMMLVNIRQPEIIETFLKSHGDRLLHNDAFSNGVSSSIVVWRDSTQDDPYLAQICRHQPESPDPHLHKLWNDLVKRPCELALQNYYTVLKRHDRLGELFRYQSLPALIASLESKPVGAAMTNAARRDDVLAEG